MATLRFSELVKRFGKPEIKSLWTAPKDDAAFMRAVKQRRILTLSQESVSKHKDSGETGFHRKPTFRIWYFRMRWKFLKERRSSASNTT